MEGLCDKSRTSARKIKLVLRDADDEVLKAHFFQSHEDGEFYRIDESEVIERDVLGFVTRVTLIRNRDFAKVVVHGGLGSFTWIPKKSEKITEFAQRIPCEFAWKRFV